MENKPTRESIMNDPNFSDSVKAVLIRTHDIGLMNLISDLSTALVVLNDELDWICKQELK